MATLIQISGNPGTGKTRSLKNLDPKTTYIIDGDRKGLWIGWKKIYSKDNKNYAAISDIKEIYKLIKGVADTRPEIKVICLLGINSIMSDKEMLESKKSGFDERYTCRIKTSLIAGITLSSIYHNIMMKYA